MAKKIFTWLGFAAGALVILFLAYQGYLWSKLYWWRTHDPAVTAFMASRLDKMRENRPAARLQQVWVPYEKITHHLKRAVLVAEDDKFIDHDGFDWQAIQKAMEKNEKRGKVVAGGSTISQQLAKNLFLTGERSMLRKGQEAIITVMMESAMDKRRILEIYLNVVEWGDGVFGAEAASRHYFGISAAALSSAQAARLAAMLPRPRYYDRNRQSQYLQTYADVILGRMPNAQLP